MDVISIINIKKQSRRSISMSNILIEANNISKIYDQDMYLKRGINFYALLMLILLWKEEILLQLWGQVVLVKVH